MNPEQQRKARSEFNAVCDAFEDAFLAGKTPDIHQVVSQYATVLDRYELFAALLDLEIYYCQQNHRAPDYERLRQLNPDFVKIIDQRQRADGVISPKSARSPDIDPSTLQEAETRVGHSKTPPQAGLPEGLVANQSFGRYRILSELGAGGMGTVYLADDSLLHRKVALKIPRLQDSDSELVERFYREAKTAAGILHRNICPVFDLGKQDGQHYITMAYIEGKPLSEFVNEQRPPSPKGIALTILKLALALEEAHRAGIVHRDLKPANVMIDRSQEPIVMDFGLARQDSIADAEKLTKTGMIMGTPAYMSPEQVRDSGKVGPAADIYSLGIILFQLLTGKLPFTGSVLTVCTRIVTEPPPRPSSIRPGVDPALESICLRAIAKEPWERFASMASFAEALRGYLDGNGFASVPSAAVNLPQQVQGTLVAAWDAAAASQVSSPTLPPRTKAAIAASAVQPVAPAALPYAEPTASTRYVPAWAYAAVSGLVTLVAFAGYVLLQPSKSPFSSAPMRVDDEGEKPLTRQLQPGQDSRALAMVFDRLQKAGALISVVDQANAIVKVKADEDLLPLADRVIDVNCARFDEMTDDDLRALLESCPRLRKLAVNVSGISAAGLEPLIGSKLEELLLIHKETPLSFNHLKQLGRMSQLRVLGAYNCGIDDQGLVLLSGLKELESLNLTANPIRGAGVESLESLAQLRKLSFSAATDSTAGMIESVSMLRGLTQLEISVDTNTDLTPLAAMQLDSLALFGPSVENIDALRGMRLQELELTYDRGLHASVLRSMTSLRMINGKPAAAFLSMP